MRSEAGGLTIRDGGAEDIAACAAINNAWIDATGWLPRIHPAEELPRFYRDHLFAACRVLVAERAGKVAGFLAMDGEGLLGAFFVDDAARGLGIGAALIAAAKALRPEGITLWTFAANAGARRFYGREGFVEVTRTEGENDEGLPDILLGWRAA